MGNLLMGFSWSQMLFLYEFPNDSILSQKYFYIIAGCFWRIRIIDISSDFSSKAHVHFPTWMECEIST